MAKPAMTQCCCCCGDLRIGSMAILIIQTILAVITIISAISLLSSGNYIDGDNEDQRRIIMNSHKDEFDVRNYTQTKTSIIIQLTLGLIGILFNAVAFYGTYMRTHSHILPWVVYNGIIMSLNILAILVMSIIFGIAFGAGMGFATFVVCSLILGIFIYMWCVVYSYYAVLQEENSRGLYDKQPYRR